MKLHPALQAVDVIGRQQPCVDDHDQFIDAVAGRCSLPSGDPSTSDREMGCEGSRSPAPGACSGFAELDRRPAERLGVTLHVECCFPHFVVLALNQLRPARTGTGWVEPG